MAYDAREWMEFCSRQLVSGLTANDAMRKMTDNPVLIGAYAESSIREFVKRFVSPLKLSTGSIIYEGNAGSKVPQLDAIIWHPSPWPPILEAGEFAMVPRSAGLAYLEIKRSNYSGVGRDIVSRLALVDELVPIWKDVEPCDPPLPRCFGIICLHTDGTSDPTLDQLIRDKRAAVILRRNRDDAEYSPDVDGIISLTNFLMLVRYRAACLDGTIELRVPASAQAPAPADEPTHLQIQVPHMPTPTTSPLFTHIPGSGVSPKVLRRRD
jgi:hypothetical protein